jgi:hypothetical protein
LAATPDEQDAQRHRSFAPSFICFGVETDTGQEPDQGGVGPSRGLRPAGRPKVA